MNSYLGRTIYRLTAEIAVQKYLARRRTGEAQAHFLNGIERLIMQLWKRI